MRVAFRFENYRADPRHRCRGGGGNAVNRMIRAEMMGVEFIACNTGRPGAPPVGRAAQDPDRRQDHPRPRRRRRRRRSGQRAAEEDSEKIAAGARRLGHGLHHRRARRRHRLRRRPGRRPDRQGGRRADDRRRDQAVRASRAPSASSSPRRRPRSSRPQVDTLITIPNDRLARRRPEEHVDPRRVPGRRRRPPPGRPGHQRHHHRAGPDQPRLRRRARDHEGRRLGAHGHRPGDRREPRRRGRPAGDRQPAPRGRHRRRAGHPVQHHRLVEPVSLFEVTEAAEEIRAAADPEANIIFGTSFNERLGDEVMITVIATGFDGGRKRQLAAPRGDRASWTRPASVRRAARARLPRGAPAPARRGRRRAVAATAAIDAADDEAAAAVAAPRVERSVGEPLAASADDDLRRGRPGDPELPPPEVTAPAAGRRTAMTDPDRRSSRTARARERGPRADRRRLRARRARPGRRSRSSRSPRPSPPTRLRDAVAAGLDAARREPRPGGAAKAPEVPGARWQLVGPLQSNKARRALEVVRARSSRSTRSSSPSGSTGWRREVRPGPRATRSCSRSTSIDDPAKAGLPRRRGRRRAIGSSAGAARTSRSAGLMTVGRLVERPGRGARPTFRGLRATCPSGCARAGRRSGAELSMGMTDDFEVAIEEGATIVPVGRAMFGGAAAS